MENLDIWALQEWVWTWTEVSEEEKKRVQEDIQSAQQTQQQIKKQQKENKEKMKFISKVLEKFFDNEKIISYLWDQLKDLDKNYFKLRKIFYFVDWEIPDSVSEYLEKLWWISLDKDDQNVVLSVVKSKKIASKEYWSNLNEEHFNALIETVKEELLKIWQKK